MKLFQRSLLHTGYFILKDGTIKPAFSADLMKEGMNKYGDQVSSMYGTNEHRLPVICEQIREFKEKYGVIPRELMDSLRTGFDNSKYLYQSKYNFFK